jgi:hypothetical protein
MVVMIILIAVTNLLVIANVSLEDLTNASAFREITAFVPYGNEKISELTLDAAKTLLGFIDLI